MYRSIKFWHNRVIDLYVSLPMFISNGLKGSKLFYLLSEPEVVFRVKMCSRY